MRSLNAAQPHKHLAAMLPFAFCNALLLIHAMLLMPRNDSDQARGATLEKTLPLWGKPFLT